MGLSFNASTTKQSVVLNAIWPSDRQIYIGLLPMVRVHRVQDRFASRCAVRFPLRGALPAVALLPGLRHEGATVVDYVVT